IKSALERLANKQSVRSAYMSQIKRLLGNDKARRFDELYTQRSKLLHDGSGRGTLGEAANSALEIALKLLLANVRAARCPDLIHSRDTIEVGHSANALQLFIPPFIPSLRQANVLGANRL